MPGDCREGIRYAAAPPRSAVRTSVERSQAGHRYRPGRGRRSDLLAPHGRAVPHQRRCLCHGACASDAHLMNTAALKRELALLRSSLAALTPAQSITLDDPVAWAERIAELTLDPWQRDVLLSAASRLLLNATRQSARAQRRRSRLPGRCCRAVLPWWSRRRCGSRVLFRKRARHLMTFGAAF